MSINEKDLAALEVVKDKLDEACELAKRVGKDNGGKQSSAYVTVDTARQIIQREIDTIRSQIEQGRS